MNDDTTPTPSGNSNEPLMEQELIRRDKIAEVAWEAINHLLEISDSLDKTPLLLQTRLEALCPTITLSDDCPHCKAEPNGDESLLVRGFNCGTTLGKVGLQTNQSELCREREEHNKTQARVKELDEWIQIAKRRIADLSCKLESEREEHNRLKLDYKDIIKLLECRNEEITYKEKAAIQYLSDVVEINKRLLKSEEENQKLLDLSNRALSILEGIITAE